MTTIGIIGAPRAARGRGQAIIARRKALRHSDVYAQRLLSRITLLCKAFQAPLSRRPYGDGELGRGL